MDSSLKIILLVGLLAAGAARAAESKSVEQVRAELERQLREMVDSPQPEVQLFFEGLNQKGYKLVEVHFTLDGERLEVPPVDKLATPGPHVVEARQMAEGAHTLVSNVVYMDDSWSLFSETSGFLWNMTSTLTFQMQRGLRARVKALPVFVPDAKDPRLKIKLTHDLTAEMIAKLDESALAGSHTGKAGPPDAGGVAVQDTPKPPQGKEPRPGSTAQVQKARLLVRATVKRKPVAATVQVRGATSQQVALKRGARKPSQVELAPGDYTVEVIAPGYLAQTRRVKLSEGNEQSLDFALVRAPKKKGVQRKGDRLEPKKPLRFAEGKAVPFPDKAGILPQLVDALVRGRIGRIRVEGHTDNREGEAGSRKALSEARARTVADKLVQAGLDPARIETAGFGDSRLKAPGFTPRARELNRRVEFIILEPGSER